MERRLGRGLGSLLGQTEDTPVERQPVAAAPGQVPALTDVPGSADAGLDDEDQVGRMLELAAIRRNPDQPRKVFESEGLEELRQSISRHGVLQPITVRRVGNGFEIISGERRWRAARNAGLEVIPAVVRDDVSDEVSLELAIVENIQRMDLDPVEKARGYRALMDRVGLTQEQVAERMGVKRSSIANQLRLLDLPEEALEALSGGLITSGHAKALLGLGEVEAIRKALSQVVRKQLSVRETEQLSRAAVAGASPSSTERAVRPEAPAWVAEMEGRLREALGVKVTLKNGNKYRGSITLDYGGREDLERICDQIAPKKSV
ncbi:MAG: ParB/RepB/Spo0J family partition protein [Planctomycetota bacterium]|nr:ParB/RepB/Spo0J family partition protein [Planctomycetota bacterium]